MNVEKLILAEQFENNYRKKEQLLRENKFSLKGKESQVVSRVIKRTKSQKKKLRERSNVRVIFHGTRIFITQERKKGKKFSSIFSSSSRQQKRFVRERTRAFLYHFPSLQRWKAENLCLHKVECEGNEKCEINWKWGGKKLKNNSQCVDKTRKWANDYCKSEFCYKISEIFSFSLCITVVVPTWVCEYEK